MTFKQRFAIQAALIAALTNVTAFAQNPTIDEIIVTGSYKDVDTSALKMEIPLIDVPQSVTVIGGEQIKKRGFSGIGDLVRHTPGINTSQGEGHRDAIVFRGVRSTADFFLDGVRDDVQYYRPLYNLQQVEILRGPNALLFGRGSTGGAVNRVIKKAMLNQGNNELNISTDTFGAYHLAADMNVSTGLHSALRVNAFSESLENDRDFYHGERIGFNPTLRVAVNDKTTLDISYELMDHERFIDRGIPTGANGAPVNSLRDIVFASPTDNLTTLDADVLRASVSHKFSNTMTGIANLHYGDYEKTYQNLYASDYDAVANTVTLDGYRDPTERTHMVMSGHVTTKFSAGGLGHTLLVGGEYIKTDSQNLRYNTQWSSSGGDEETFDIPTGNQRLNLSQTADGDATAVNYDSDLASQTETDITATSLFVQDQIAVTEQLQLLLGARLDNFDITVTDIKNSSEESRKDEQVSPRFGLIYKPQGNLSLYASMSESFLPRSNEQYKKLDANAARLDPDVFENNELGIKWDISEALKMAVSLFDSEQETAVSSGDGSAYIQGLSVDGFEVEISGQLSDKTALLFGYASLDGTTKDNTRPRELPDTMYSIFVDHEANERLTYGIGLTHQDASLIKDGSTTYLPAYTRVDASLSYAISGDMSLRVNIENLTDEAYYPHAHSTHQVSVGDPMKARVSLTRSF